MSNSQIAATIASQCLCEAEVSNQTILISKHAQRRMKQRGVSLSDVEFLLKSADREVPVGDNCLALSVSRGWLQREGRRSMRLENLVAVVRDDWQMVISVIHATGQQGRHYRKDWRN